MNKKLTNILMVSFSIISLSSCYKSPNLQGYENNKQVNTVFKMNKDNNSDFTLNKLKIDDSKDIITGFKNQEAIETFSVDIGPIESQDNKKQGWGLGPDRNEKGQPIDAVNFQEKYGKYDAYFIGNSGKKNIYFTFDEGYENGYTAPILDILKEKNVSAVFFVTQHYAVKNPDLIKRMIDEGHIIGNHSSKHKSFPKISIEECKEEVKGLHEYMKENYNYEMDLFRFPCGEFSEKTLELLCKMGYKSVFWSFSYADYDENKQLSCDKAKEKILTSMYDDSILLLHAVSKTNTEVLGEVIDKFRENGYNLSLLNFENK